MHDIRLIWRGPYTFHDLILNNKDLPRNMVGVYFHAEEISGSTYICYAGKALGSPDIIKRQREHYLHMIGGMYTIPLNYRCSKKEWVPDDKNDEFFETIFDKNKFVELIREAYDYAHKLRIYIATEEFAKEEVPLIERKLLFEFKPLNTYWGTTTDPNPNLNIIHDGVIKDTHKKWIVDTNAFTEFRSGSHRRGSN